MFGEKMDEMLDDAEDSDSSHTPLPPYLGSTANALGIMASGGQHELNASGARLHELRPKPSLQLPLCRIELATEDSTDEFGLASPVGPTPESAKASSRNAMMQEKLGRRIAIDTKLPLSPTTPAKQSFAQTPQCLQKEQVAPTPKGFRYLEQPEAITDYYDLGESLAGGNCRSEVKTAIRRSDGSEVVVKVRAKQNRRSQTTENTWKAVMSQMQTMQGNGHVLDILELLEDASAFYIVMPRCKGGELYNFLVTEAEVPEVECKRIIREILVAVGHLHKNNLIHRDIKPENILFDMDDSSSSPSRKVKLIDFDTCLEWSPSSTPKMRRFAGTAGYIAPEALLGEATPQSDLFSVGVILHILMTGETPWTEVISLEEGIVGSRCAMRMYNTLKAQVTATSLWDESPWTEFPMARSLCQQLMAFDPKQRPVSVDEALAHPWLCEA